MLIDTHTHAVSADLQRYPQRRTPLANGVWWEGVDCSFEALTAGLDASPVDAVVLVQAAGPYGDDNTYLSDAVATADERFVGACIVDPTVADAVDRLVVLGARPGIAGVRLFHVPTPTDPWLAAPAGDALVDAAADGGLSVSVCCLPDALAALAVQLERRPDVDFVLDHCGLVDFSGGLPYPGAADLWALCDLPNLHLKFTPTCAALSGADPAPLLVHLISRVGPARIVWGSDWPQHREASTYAGQVDHIVSWMDGLPAADRDAVAGENARRLWPRAWSHLAGDRP